jgi:hypothetical protein
MRELVITNEGPPRRPRLDELELAHLRLITTLAGECPNRIVGNADRFDLMNRAAHLTAVFAAVTAYARAAVADTAEALPIILRDETPSLDGAADDVVDAFLNAQDRMRDLAAALEE